MMNSIKQKIDKSNIYIQEHSKAKIETQINKILVLRQRVNEYLIKMKLNTFCQVIEENRVLKLEINEKTIDITSQTSVKKQEEMI